MIALALALLAAPAHAGLEDEIGRTEVRIVSAPYPLRPGRTVAQAALPERLERLGYTRVHARPSRPGEYFWGKDVFWIWRRAHRVDGKPVDARLIGLVLRSDGMIVGAIDASGAGAALEGAGAWLEPEILAESLDEVRAIREPIALADVPEHVWRPLLALEDARFFDHVGVDGRAIARAALANVRSGSVEQGGSTITQQLVKNRDLTSKRTLDRKASEAVRALALEAEHDKEEILQAYLNSVYYGHVDGVAIHGIGAASRVFFSKRPEDLTLAEAALLAAVVQGPNGLSPIRHPDKAKERRDRALDRMQELGWATAEEVAAAKASPIELHRTAPRTAGAEDFRAYVTRAVEAAEPDRAASGLGFAVETTLDPYVQALAEEAVADHLDALRKKHPRLADQDLQAALVALDADSGAVLAYVGGDPDVRDGLDRAGVSQRQPGSTVKPLLLLEAFEDCGVHDALGPKSRVSDAPLAIALPTGTWAPDNFDHRDHGVVDVRDALIHSYNRPFVRIAGHCGTDETATRLRATGLALPEDPPPSFALGAVETTPIALAGAYTVFATPGKVAEPFGVVRIERPGGGKLDRDRPAHGRASSPATAWLVRDLLADAVAEGTGKAAAASGVEVVGKTGTTAADAWFAGQADGIVVVVWVGRDDGGALDLTGGSAAAPLFAAFVEDAAPARPAWSIDKPGQVAVRRVLRGQGAGQAVIE